MAATRSRAQADPGTETWVDAARQVWFAGLGTAVTAAAGANLVFKAMVEEGEKFARRERPDVEKALVIAGDRVKEMSEQVEIAVEDAMSAGLRRFGVPTRQDVRRLAVRIEKLSAKLETLDPAPRFLRGSEDLLQQEPN